MEINQLRLCKLNVWGRYREHIKEFCIDRPYVETRENFITLLSEMEIGMFHQDLTDATFSINDRVNHIEITITCKR